MAGQTREFHILEGVRHKGRVQVLVDKCTMEDGQEYSDFFLPGTTGIVDVGTVQIMGDTDMMDDSYTAD